MGTEVSTVHANKLVIYFILYYISLKSQPVLSLTNVNCLEVRIYIYVITLFFSEQPGGEIDTEKLAFGIERFLCVFQSQLDKHTIMYSGTVDGIRLRGKRPVEDKGDRSSVLEMLNGADLVDLHTIMDNKEPNKSNIFR